MEESETRNSTRSCPGNLQSTLYQRSQFPRRSLKELNIGVASNLEPFVHGTNLVRKSGDVVNLSKPSVAGSVKSTSERIDEQVHKYYYTIAYALVVVAYFIGFGEYLYFRLVSLLEPDNTLHHPTCEMKQKRRVGKEGFHYGISIAAFIAIALVQLICFFGLTISENWTICRVDEDDPFLRQRQQISKDIRNLIRRTMYRVFTCYGICSLINCLIIFYMVGIQDSLGDTVSTICLYIFDVVVILYFIAFPLTTVVYHPHVYCCKSKTSHRQAICGPSRSKTSTLESTVNELEHYMNSPRRHAPTTTIV